MINKLDVQLFCDLKRLGVTQVTLTKEACDALTESLKGLYKSCETNPEIEREIDCGWRGDLAGIRFYREV